jgi:hypothetical protein
MNPGFIERNALPIMYLQGVEVQGQRRNYSLLARQRGAMVGVPVTHPK